MTGSTEPREPGDEVPKAPRAPSEEDLARVEDLRESGDTGGAWRELEILRSAFPRSLDLQLLEAGLLRDAGRLRDALEKLEKLFSDHPDCYEAGADLCDTLFESGDFRGALAASQSLIPLAVECGKEEEAWLRRLVGSSLDRLGREKEADREFSKAAALDPEGQPMPQRLRAAEFERLVARALDTIPAEFDRYLHQVLVQVRDYPSPNDPDPFLLGLYVGVPRTDRTHELRDHLDHVFLFKRNLEIWCPDRETLRVEIQKTVVHELAHHFGMDEADMGEYA